MKKDDLAEISVFFLLYVVHCTPTSGKMSPNPMVVKVAPRKYKESYQKKCLFNYLLIFVS